MGWIGVHGLDCAVLDCTPCHLVMLLVVLLARYAALLALVGSWLGDMVGSRGWFIWLFRLKDVQCYADWQGGMSSAPTNR
jgi:hypothetical protein